MAFAALAVLSVLLLSTLAIRETAISVAAFFTWAVLFFICLARAIDVYDSSWPANGCYLAICTRHGTDGFGTPKTSLSADELRHLWQGGVDSVFDGVALTLIATITLAVTLVLRSLVASYEARHLGRAHAAWAQANSHASHTVSYSLDAGETHSTLV